jgi:dipeptide transport system substrate-binding protein
MKLVLGCLTAAVLASTAQAKTLVYCSEGSPEGFDPALYTAGTTFNASSRPVYNRLAEFERGTTNVIPGLAESWSASADGLEYTFNLRAGVKFHSTSFFTPSRDFNADDVIFSFQRQLDEAHPWHKYTEGTAWEYFNGMDMPNLIKEIVKVDDMTVKFVLNKPESPTVANLAMDFASIVSKEYADTLAAKGMETNLNQQPIGTGPFQFVAYQKDAVIRYQAHGDYWNGKQPIDDLIFAITTDNSVRMQKLKAGESHVAPYPKPADLPALQADSSLHVMQQEG